MTKTISVKELRQHLPKIRRSIARGDRFVIIYRSKPFAELSPMEDKQTSTKEMLEFFANPPKEALFKSDISAVELIRREREET